MLALLTLLVLTFGACGSKYAYKPEAPAAAAGAPALLPFKVAVVAFGDGTEDFTKKGSYFSGYEFNLAKTGINGMAINTGAAFHVSPLPPEYWAKAFAEDLGASGAFRSVKLVLDRSGLSDEELVIEGTLLKATYRTKKGEPDEFHLRLKALRVPGGNVAWEGDVSRNAPRPSGLADGCSSEAASSTGSTATSARSCRGCSPRPVPAWSKPPRRRWRRGRLPPPPAIRSTRS
jgi:hypothetical protein